MHDFLNVYLKGVFVGQFSCTNGTRYEFCYTPDYLANPTEGPLSFSLPLQKESFDTERSYNYFANLLPPVVVRKKLEKCIHVSKNNVFGFLKEIGGDCAGAVALYPPWIKPENPDEEKVRELDEAEAVSILQSLRRRPLYAAGEDGYRYSGAGAQDKLVARVKDGKVVLPLFGTPSTHIIKSSAADFEDSVANELFCQRLAAKLKLKAAKASVIILGGERYYVTERFDRENINGHPRRLHQEDFCQMLSVDPETKYESDGGPTAVQCLETLRSLHATVRETIAFIDIFIYNYLIGNADAHAKNYSVVYFGLKPVLAPLYDAVSTVVYPELSRNFAMSVGGDSLFGKITRDSFIRFAHDLNVSPAFVLSRLDNFVGVISAAAESLAEEMQSTLPSPIYKKIIHVIAEQKSTILPLQ